MIIEGSVAVVQAELLRAARSRCTIPFSDLFCCFDKTVVRYDAYDTLEEASVRIARLDEAIYTVLLAKRNTGLPGDGFFDIFRIHRLAEWRRITKGAVCSTADISFEYKRKMAEYERDRVYVHALSCRGVN